MNLRKATINDLKDIQKLNKMLFDLEYSKYDNTLNVDWPYSEDGINYYKDSIENKTTLVCEDNNNIVGYLIGELNTEYSYNNIKQAEMCNMYILEEYRGKGIGTKFFKEFKNICKNNGIKEIKLVASYDNKDAIEFYKKNSFKEKEITFKINVEGE